MGLLLLRERNCRESGCRLSANGPPLATLRRWVLCCWTQHCWRDLRNPAAHIASHILPVLWVATAAATAASQTYYGTGIKQPGRPQLTRSTHGTYLLQRFTNSYKSCLDFSEKTGIMQCLASLYSFFKVVVSASIVFGDSLQLEMRSSILSQ